jgi:hypothetical protein
MTPLLKDVPRTLHRMEKHIQGEGKDRERKTKGKKKQDEG